jgi:hypothetical protein
MDGEQKVHTPVKYFIYEMRMRTAPFHDEYYGYLIYDKTKDQVATIVYRPSMREARARCKEVVQLFSLGEESTVVWRNWPLVVNTNYTEEDILQLIKEREI